MRFKLLPNTLLITSSGTNQGGLQQDDSVYVSYGMYIFYSENLSDFMWL